MRANSLTHTRTSRYWGLWMMLPTTPALTHSRPTNIDHHGATTCCDTICCRSKRCSVACCSMFRCSLTSLSSLRLYLRIMLAIANSDITLRNATQYTPVNTIISTLLWERRNACVEIVVLTFDTAVGEPAERRRSRKEPQYHPVWRFATTAKRDIGESRDINQHAITNNRNSQTNLFSCNSAAGITLSDANRRCQFEQVSQTITSDVVSFSFSNVYPSDAKDRRCQRMTSWREKMVVTNNNDEKKQTTTNNVELNSFEALQYGTRQHDACIDADPNLKQNVKTYTCVCWAIYFYKRLPTSNRNVDESIRREYYSIYIYI